MGAYNTVTILAKCKACGSTASVTVQFKFGETRQIDYVVGDRLRWGGNDIGRPGLSRVVVAGAGEDCTACGAEGGDYEVWIERDVIVRVDPVDAPSRFLDAQETFVIIEA